MKLLSRRHADAVAPPSAETDEPAIADRRRVTGTVSLSDPEHRATAAYCGVDEDILGTLATWADAFDAAAPGIADDFYAHLLVSDAAEVLRDHSTVERQRPILIDYVRSLYAGRVDDDYVAGRLRIGQVHDQVGLSATRYFGQYRWIVGGLTQAAVAAGATLTEAVAVADAAQTLCTFDAALATEAYIESRDAVLLDSVEQMRAVASRLTESSSGLAATSEQTQASTEVMAGQSNDLARSAEQLASATDQMSKAASAGVEVILAASDGSERAAAALETVTVEVASLTENAARISEIIALIRGIAAQTNLLALNAAIEAARAGDAGRGFAVVADEVKALAESTDEALGDVTSLITSTEASVTSVVAAVERTSKTVSETTVHANSAAEAFRSIETQVGRTSEDVSSMAAASEELGAVSQELRLASATVASEAEAISTIAAELASA